MFKIDYIVIMGLNMTIDFCLFFLNNNMEAKKEHFCKHIFCGNCYLLKWILILRSHQAVLKIYSWLCSQVQLYFQGSWRYIRHWYCGKQTPYSLSDVSILKMDELMTFWEFGKHINCISFLTICMYWISI